MPRLGGINLLQKEKIKKLTGFSSKIRIWGSIILVVYIICVGGLFFLVTYFSSSLEKTKLKNTELEQNIKLLQKRESLVLTMKERVGQIKNILAGRSDFPTDLRKIQKLSPEGIIFEKIEMSQEQFSLAGKAENIIVLGDFLDELTENTDDFSKVLLTSLYRQQKGSYYFSLEVSIKK